MKKILLVTTFLFLIGKANSQTPKFVYCSILTNDKTHLIISDVVDVTSLPKNEIKETGPNGKKTLVDYYTEIAKTWFGDILHTDDYDSLVNDIDVKILGVNAVGSAACPTANEDGCFILNKEALVLETHKLALPTILIK